MKLRAFPKSLSGKWSIGLSIVFIILILAKIQYSIRVPTFAITTLGLTGFLIGIIAIFKNKDRTILNFLPILVGLLILIWIAAELIFQH